MPKVPLQSFTISQLSDGFTGRVVDQALSNVVQDIIDRGEDGKARKLVVTFTFTPDQHSRVDIDTEVSVKLPSLRPPGTQAKLDHAAGGLIFNPDCSENPDQNTFADAEAK